MIVVMGIYYSILYLFLKRSFSENEKLNHLIGHLSHTPILVPYHSWRISHHKHHLNTGNIKNVFNFCIILNNK